MLVGSAAGLLYLRGLAARIPRPSLAQQTSVATWGYVTTQSLGVLVGAVFIIMLPRWMGATGATGTLGPDMLFALLGSCVVGLGTLIFGVWVLVLLFVYISALKAAATQARASWAADATRPAGT